MANWILAENAALAMRDDGPDPREERMDRRAAAMADNSAEEMVRDELAWLGRAAFAAAIAQGQPFAGACFYSAAAVDRAELDVAWSAYAFLEA